MCALKGYGEKKQDIPIKYACPHRIDIELKPEYSFNL